MLNLNINGIQDPIVRENFRRLEEAFRLMSVLNGNWKLMDVNFTASDEVVLVPHNLPFVPKDFIVLSAVGDQGFDFVTNDFNSSTIPVYISGPVNIRFLVGRAK